MAGTNEGLDGGAQAVTAVMRLPCGRRRVHSFVAISKIAKIGIKQVNVIVVVGKNNMYFGKSHS